MKWIVRIEKGLSASSIASLVAPDGSPKTLGKSIALPNSSAQRWMDLPKKRHPAKEIKDYRAGRVGALVYPSSFFEPMCVYTRATQENKHDRRTKGRTEGKLVKRNGYQEVGSSSRPDV